MNICFLLGKVCSNIKFEFIIFKFGHFPISLLKTLSYFIHIAIQKFIKKLVFFYEI